MISHIEISGKHYYNVTSDYLASEGVDFSIIDAALKSVKWKEITQKRNQLLAETDWTQGQDSPLSTEKLSELSLYRQALRDIPQTYTDPSDVVWPIKPTF